MSHEKEIKMKKRGLVRGWIYVWVLAVCVMCGQKLYAQGGLAKIADNVFSYLDVKGASPANSFGANAGIVIGRNGIVVIDTLTSAREAKRLIRDIRAVSDKPIKFVINTHYHLDHAFGDSEFEKLGAVIIAHSNSKKDLEAYGEYTLKNVENYGLSEEEMEGTEIPRPVLTFNDRMGIDLGDQKIELLYPGPSHTSGSILVYLPDKKILFSGDLLFTNYHPFLGDGDIESWGRALDQIMMMDVTTIIPGHGPISSKKDIAEMKDYLLLFDRKAKEISSRSSDLGFIISEMKKALPPRRELDSLIPANIQMKYLKK